MRKRITILFVLTFISLAVFPQSEKKLFKKAYQLFNEEHFEEALPLFLQLDSIKKDDFYIKYYLGACYLNTRYEKHKALPYLEYALKHGKKLLPKTVFLDLARLYHLTYQFEKSNQMIQNYLKLADTQEDSGDIQFARQLIRINNRAQQIYADSLKYATEKLPYPINTPNNSEYGAFISADGNIMYFTRTYFHKHTKILRDSVTKILKSEKENGNWTYPKEIILPENTSNTAVLVGISYDGNFLFLKIGEGNNSDLYTTKVRGYKCDSLVKLPDVINSPFYEGGLSFTPEGDIFYFSSNRPGGYGGKDIYKVVRHKDGTWSQAENMGPSINTPYDEDFPFIHPGGNLLYYASNSPDYTIGGYDILKVKYSAEKHSWSLPENVGFSINTPDDDIGFVTNAEGNIAYYSSKINNEKGFYDIYKAEIEASIPLTMIKGFVYRKDTKQPIESHIKIYDKSNNSIVKYVYNPNPHSGRYIMILPPGKDYIMVVEAKGFYPYVIEIHVPHQSYFYELYQEILLEPIIFNQTDTLGEKITVNNIFYDTDKFFKSDTANAKAIAKAKNYESLLNIVHDLVNLTDSVGINYLNMLYADKSHSKQEQANKNKKYERLIKLVNKAINETDTTILKRLEENTAFKDKRKAEFYYTENHNDSTYLKTVIVGNDTIKVARIIKIKKGFSPTNLYEILTPPSPGTPEEKKTKLKHIKTLTIYYNSSEFKVPDNYYPMLEELTTLLKHNKNLIIALHGYADQQGNKSYNQNLSYKRAFEVSRFFKEHGIQGKRVQLFAHGELKSGNMKKNRKVEIKIFEKVK